MSTTSSTALDALRAGQGADLLMMTSSSTSPRMIDSLEAGAHPRAGGRLRHRRRRRRRRSARSGPGPRNIIPLPPDAELIAAVLAGGGATTSHAVIYRDPAMEAVVRLADQVAPSDAIDPDHRRERHRQGGDGALHPPQEPPRQAPLHLGQLRGDPREPAGKRAVRPREGRLHRRRGAAHRQVRGGRTAAPCCSTKSARWIRACRPSCCAPSRSARSTASAAPSRSRSTSASSPPPTATSSRGGAQGQLPRGPALSASTSSTCACPALRERPARHRAAGRPFRQEIRRGQRRARAGRCRPSRAASCCTTMLARQCARAENAMHRAVLLAAATRSSRVASGCRTASRGTRPAAEPAPRRRHRPPAPARPGRPHRGRCRARSHPRHPAALPRQPHPRRQHPRHLDPHPAQQAAAVSGWKGSRAAGRRAGAGDAL